MTNRDFIKGVDISTLFEEEECGAKYYDLEEGSSFAQGKYKKNSEELLTILKRYGINSVRIRLWNDPYSENGEKYGAGTNDLEKALRLARLVKEADMSILFDFHYSDFWADPGKQTTPKAWRNMSVSELTNKVYEYTEMVMNKLKENGTLPEYVQVGNELTNGLLWPTGRKPFNEEELKGEYKSGYDNIARLVSAGIKAVKKVCPESRIMIHLDNGGNNPMYRDWFDNYLGRINTVDGVINNCPTNQKDMIVEGLHEFNDAEDFDIIGMSYYPFWHGSLSELSANMKDMEKRYGKQIVVAEVSMGFTMENYASYEQLGEEDRKGMATKKELCEGLEYPMTKEGQSDFMQDFMSRVKDVDNALGFYYWEPAWIPVPGCGWANRAALEYTKEKGPGGNEWANQALFDFDGRVLPALLRIEEFCAGES